MNAELKQKWVDALRSGKYKQGVGVLRSTNDKFCCLGVLCDIEDVPKQTNTDEYRYIFGGHCNGVATQSSCFIYGRLREEITEPHYTSLMKMNDSGIEFTEIATYIEENL